VDVGKPIALGLTVVSLAGGGEKLTAWALDDAGHDSSDIARDAGPLGGTILHDQERGGYVALGWRQPIELRRPYRGGSPSDYLT
jgi:hypothetical protein